jgi:peptidoglycan/xylan/chitin deacetylase (PgdA/CDA1 family)
MSFGAKINKGLLSLDLWATGLQLRLSEPRGLLVAVYLHNLFKHEEEMALDLAYPQQCITVNHLRAIIEWFLERQFQFISTADLLRGLHPRGRYALLTFDDGYFNNTMALPLMEEYRVPAVFFVPVQFVIEERGFWWDALYRSRRRAGVSQRAACSEIFRRAGARTEDLEAEIQAELRVTRFSPVGDIDRLFTPNELRDFSRHPLVEIGNHGCLHEYLPHYSKAEVVERISRAQSCLREITGRLPQAIAYPTGAASPTAINAARAGGIKLGFTTDHRKENVRSLTDQERRLRIGRFTVRGEKHIPDQCRHMLSGLMLHRRYVHFVQAVKRGFQITRSPSR